MIKFKDIFQLNEATGGTNIPFQVKKLVDEANTLIDQSIKDEWYAIEPNGTWESVYEFKPITIGKTDITIKYTEPLDGNKFHSEKLKFDDYDIIETLRWVIRSLKKGIKNKDK